MYGIYSDYIDKLNSILATESTFMETLIKGSGINYIAKRKHGIKIHIVEKINPNTLPLKAIITSANVFHSRFYSFLLD